MENKYQCSDKLIINIKISITQKAQTVSGVDYFFQGN